MKNKTIESQFTPKTGDLVWVWQSGQETDSLTQRKVTRAIRKQECGFDLTYYKIDGREFSNYLYWGFKADYPDTRFGRCHYKNIKGRDRFNDRFNKWIMSDLDESDHIAGQDKDVLVDALKTKHLRWLGIQARRFRHYLKKEQYWVDLARSRGYPEHAIDTRGPKLMERLVLQVERDINYIKNL